MTYHSRVLLVVALGCGALLSIGCPARRPVRRRPPVTYAVRLPEPRPELSLSDARAGIYNLLGELEFSGEVVGVHVIPLSKGRTYVSVNATERMIPASNMKLVTTAAALSILGPRYRFATEVRLHEGALYIKGSGDPMLGVLHLKDMARMILADKRTKGFNGTVFLDAGLFEEHEQINSGFRRSGSFNTALGPLSVDHNRVVLYLFGSGPDHRRVKTITPRVTPDPEGFTFSISKRPIGFDTHHKPQFDVTWDEEEERHEIKAYPPVDSGRHRLAVRRPTEHFGSVFTRLARAEGLDVREVRRGETPKGARLLFAYKSRPLYEILRYMNLHSDNFVAEQVFLAIGAHGGGRAFEDASEAVSRFLVRKVGLREGRFTVFNGSGLSRRSRLSPAQMTKLLAYVERDAKISGAFMSTLPIAGWSGTMKRRLLDPPGLLRISAKTGMIDYVSGVSGYGVGAGGKRFAFSIMINDRDGMEMTGDMSPLEREAEDEWQKTTDINNRFKSLQDRILDILARTRF